jgi:hypothetical protein
MHGGQFRGQLKLTGEIKSAALGADALDLLDDVLVEDGVSVLLLLSELSMT